MNEPEARPLWLWLAVSCGIVVVVVVTTFAPHLLGGPVATRPVGAVALRSLVTIVIAYAAYRALVARQRVSNEQDTR